ncbi:MAG: VWA domain-containing protein [Planctomycetota bacterium]|jgi:hypothetical protein
MTSGKEKGISGTDGLGVTDADAGEVCVCPHCDQRIRFKPSHAGKKAKCPGCGKLITLSGATPPFSHESPRQDRFSSVAGWVTSIALHSLLLLSFTGITWFSGLGAGAGEREVGIVVESDASIHSGGSAGLSPLEPSSPDLTAPPLATSEKKQPIESLGGSAASSGTDVEINVGSLDGGAADPVKGDWSSLSAGEGGAGGKGASFFGLEARGGKFVYVVDRSSSMRGNKLQDTKVELIRSVHSLTRTMEFFIIFYDSSFEPMAASGLVKATGPNKSRYLSWVEAMGCRGGTDPREAMLMALSLKPDSIWLLSDGQFNPQACDVIRAANPNARVQIHTIAFHSQRGQQVLQRIAEENGGHYRFVPPPRSLMPGGFPPGRRRP